MGDDCDRSQNPAAWNDDKCANRCRVANGMDYRRCYDGHGGRADWWPRRNFKPQDVWEYGYKSCDCQWMSSNDGSGDDCKGGCDANDCASKCRNANPDGTCLADWSARHALRRQQVGLMLTGKMHLLTLLRPSVTSFPPSRG